MRITYEKTQYFTFAFEYTYSTSIMEYCRFIKQTYGWKEFNFNQGKWRFNNPTIISLIQMQFPGVVITDDVKKMIKEEENRQKESIAIQEKAKEIRLKEDSDISIPGIKGDLYPYQKIGVEFFTNSKGRAILADTMGTGKAQPHGSKVLTPNGWKNIETLMIGDIVLHPRGRRQKVVGFFPQGKKDVYNVIFSDNSRTSCCEDHLWEVYTSDSKFRKAKNRVMPLKEIIKNGLTHKNGNNKWYIPMVSPSLDFESIENNIHPYLLGVLLGDGGLTGNTPRLTSGDAYIVDRISKLIKRYGLKLVKSGKYDYSISGKRPLKNKLTVELRKLGLMGKSSLEKGIPNSYLFQSKKRREELLAGLLDTDGYIEKGKNTIEYSSSSKKLATDVLHLINSLGGKGTINKKETKCSPSYRIHFSLPNSVVPFRLPRKVKNYKLHTKYYPSRAIVRIEKRKAKEQCVCIKVSEEDGLYITDDFIVTHNTAQTLGYLLAAGHKRTLVVCPASVKYSWEGEVKKWTNLESFVVTSQTDFFDVPSSANVIIINYDVLKKHFKALMAKHWDCCVLDESQMIKSPTAIRTKAVKILTREIRHVIMLSGTPLLSRPIELFTMLNIIDPLTWKNYYEYATRYCAGHRGKWGFEAKGATNLAELTERISRYFLRRTKDQVLKNLPPKNKMILPIDLSGDSLKDYKKASKEFMKFLKENKKKKAKEIAKTMQAERLTKINYLREIAVMGRLDAAKELIDSIIDAGEKVLVFSSFNAPLEELYDHYFDKAIMITGKTDVEERGDIVKRFQSDPSVQVFLGGFLSAGTGITLTAAQNVVLLDYPWRPGDTEQAIDRCHRPGTTASSINIYQMHSRGTIDDFMKKTLERKQAIFDVVVDSQKVGPKDEDMVDELIKLLEKDEI